MLNRKFITNAVDDNLSEFTHSTNIMTAILGTSFKTISHSHK